MRCWIPIADYPIYRFEMPVITSNMYVMPIGEECLIVDPFVSEEAVQIIKEHRINRCLVLLSHEHLDHISGVNWLRELYPCEVVCSRVCAERMADPRKSGAAYFEALFLNHSHEEQSLMRDTLDFQYTCRADKTYQGEIRFEWQGLEINLRETPGHSPGSQVIQINERIFFTGDSLILGQEVITRLPGGNKKDFNEKTLPYLQAIPKDSIIFPGHGSEMQYMVLRGEE